MGKQRVFSHDARMALRLLILVVSLLGAILMANGRTRPVAELAAADTAVVNTAVAPSPRSSANTSTTPVYGVNFINSVDHPADATQFANGQATGAVWNRWPLYWYRIETAPGQFDWSQHDAVIAADIANGLGTNAILLGTPGFYTTATARSAEMAPERQPAPGRVALQAVQAAAPQGLYEPVFADGTDVSGPDKQINDDNRWARFVYLIVRRYKPGGELARAQEWPAGVGITHWEMWNEPDFILFWDSSLADYARLLQVGYLAAKHADPQATVLFGGLANNSDPDFYGKVLAHLKTAPQATEHGYFHDIFATHSYHQSWNSWLHVWQAGRDMADYGLHKPIWVNESGVPAWNDYPGPVWDPKSGLRATTSEQADYVIQSVFYALFAGADGYFHFQLYDGCGNQPAGTDFPPHDGELCDANGRLLDDPSKPCAGDAHGLFRNPTDAVCFSQHPQPESPRPNFAAYQIVTTYMQNVLPLWRARPGGSDPYNGPQEHIAFYRADTQERIVGMWSRFGEETTAVITAVAGQAKLIYPDGTVEIIYPVDGQYTVTLPRATNQNAFWDPELYMIGGPPRILIEELSIQPQIHLPLVRR